MKKLFYLLFLFAGFLALAPPGGPGLAQRAARERPTAGPRLQLRGAAFDPLAGEPAIPDALRSALAADRPGLRLVQFPGPIRDAWYQAMTDAGLAVVTYLPDYGYLVWGDEAAVTALAAAAPVRWTGPYQPAYALHPALARPTDLPAAVDVTVQIYSHPAVGETVQAILAHASAVYMQPHPVLVYHNLSVQLAAADLPWLIAQPGVVNVEPYGRPRALDEVQGQIVAGRLNAAGTQPTGPGYLSWLIGLGFSTDPAAYPIVDVTDSGIDNGSATPLHPDFYVAGSTANPDRLVYNRNWSKEGGSYDVTGHGTVVASVVAGYNDRTGFPYEDADGYNYGLGVNPFGPVAGSKVLDSKDSWSTDASPTTLISTTYTSGGRIVNNSWGSFAAGQYSVQAQEYDARVRDAQPGGGPYAGNQEITVIFAAGNSGPRAATILEPGTAKNVITVGAAENYRPGWTDGCRMGPEHADSAQDVAYFSSHGPCVDGRVKPDLVAPGTHLLGAASQYAGYSGTGVCNKYWADAQTLYAAAAGTSVAAPAVAGAASLLYGYYQARWGAAPSPAMVKAYLLQSTRYLTGVYANDNLPSNNQGYGELDLGLAFDGAPRVVLDQTHVFSESGQVFTQTGAITATNQALRVTLAWTDAPGPTAGAAYVNDLDLEVALGGQTYRGNVFSRNVSQPGGTADRVNNVESVFLPAGQSGVFTVRVIAANIAGDGVPGNADPADQDFALVIYQAAASARRLYLPLVVRGQ